MDPSGGAQAAQLREWRQQKRSAWLYRRLAAWDRHREGLFRALAEAADRQAGAVAQGLSSLPRFRPPIRARFVAALARLLGVDRLRPMLTALNLRGLAARHRMPTSTDEIGANHRRASSGTLRAAVFGVSDGLVSNTSLILALAGAGADARSVLLAAVGGLLAGALSMAAGEYISMRSQRDLFESQIADEREELKRFPREEAEELALIHAARGVPLDQARAMALALVQDQDKALDVLAREELGLDPDDLGSPLGSALSSFVAFALGAVVPALPFLLGVRAHALTWTMALAALGLFAAGGAISLFAGTSALRGGLRMTLIGAGAGAVTFGLGTLFGVGLG